jgi:hypothetical protein
MILKRISAKAHNYGISLNPILNSFQQTVKEYNITDDMIQSFLKSMKLDLSLIIIVRQSMRNIYMD